jgi:ATP-binding cassette subfamily B protein
MEYKGKMFASKIEIDIETDLFKHFQSQDFSFYDEQKVGKLMSHITTDAYNLTNVIKSTPEIVLNVIIRFLAVFTFLFFYNKVFGFVLLGAFILNFIFMWYVLPKVQKANKYSREVFSNISSDLEENLSGIRTIKSFANEQIEISKFSNNSKTYLNAKDKIYSIHSVFYSGLLLFVISIAPIITVVGALFIINDLLTLSDVIAFILYIGVLESPLWDIVNLNEFVREGIIGFNRIIDMLEVKPQITESINAVNLENVSGNIEFKDVFFKYEKTNKNIFEKLSLKINSGEYIAIVGSSGVGKSTFGNLIPRFYDVFSGEILIDGVNVKEIKLANLRQNIGFVHQDTFLFSGTIIENIRYGKPDATDEEVVEAAKNVYAHDFIMNFVNGYDTQIGTRGLKLSGGQKQRLAIARVFLKNPPILIFDEATSSLDNESERYIQKSMEKLAIGRTTIVIAHRLSTIKNAKRILVLANGEIVEEGTHAELLSKNGAYAEFYSLL